VVLRTADIKIYASISVYTELSGYGLLMTLCVLSRNMKLDYKQEHEVNTATLHGSERHLYFIRCCNVDLCRRRLPAESQENKKSIK